MINSETAGVLKSYKDPEYDDVNNWLFTIMILLVVIALFGGK